MTPEELNLAKSALAKLREVEAGKLRAKQNLIARNTFEKLPLMGVAPPPQTPPPPVAQDVAIRKPMWEQGVKCSGFLHPHFHNFDG